MRILIIGSGAVGSFLGARLSLSGQQVTLVARPATVEAVRSQGLELLEPGLAPKRARVEAVTDLTTAFAFQPYDLALLTVKAYDTAATAAELAGLAAQGLPLPPLLTLANGVGNEETLAAALPAATILSGAIDTPVTLAGNRVELHGTRNRIGLAPEGREGEAARAVEQARTMLVGAGFAVTAYGDHRSLKWTKLLMNVLANASCAILDWTPAQVMADPRTARLEARAWQETLAVMAALRIPPVSLGGYPFPLIAPVARRLPPAVLALGLRSFVSGGRGSKMPSLQLALDAGKRTEAPWLNGAVVSHGAQAGVPTPVNRVFADLLQALTSGALSRATYRHRPDLLSISATDL